MFYLQEEIDFWNAQIIAEAASTPSYSLGVRMKGYKPQ
jgi:hypothetical protein